MKLMIASDIHGSFHYCKKLVDCFYKEKAEFLLLLGDLLYHGPRNDLPKGYAPKEVITMLNSLKEVITAVRGNCEAEVDQMVLDFPCMADHASFRMDDIDIFATHGHLYGDRPPFKGREGRPYVLLSGHTHVPALRIYDSHIYMNPGSVSIPKEGSHHGYMMYEAGVFLWKDLSGVLKDEYVMTR